MLWARKWRLKLSIVKTEFCVFSLDNQVLDEAGQYILDTDGQVLKYYPKPKPKLIVHFTNWPRNEAYGT